MPGGKATLASLNGTLASALNAVESADAAPTQQAYALVQTAEGSLQALLADWQRMQQQDLAALNRQLRRARMREIGVQ
jgi:hypothetical protein